MHYIKFDINLAAQLTLAATVKIRRNIMETLSISSAKQIIGRIITWTAPSDPSNKQYKGTAIITEVNPLDKNPLKCQTIEGDNLEFAFCEFAQPSKYDELSYSDGGRLVTFNLIG